MPGIDLSCSVLLYPKELSFLTLFTVLEDLDISMPPSIVVMCLVG